MSTLQSGLSTTERKEEKVKEEKELEKASSLQREPECGKRWRKGLRIRQQSLNEEEGEEEEGQWHGKE